MKMSYLPSQATLGLPCNLSEGLYEALVRWHRYPQAMAALFEVRPLSLDRLTDFVPVVQALCLVLTRGVWMGTE